MNENQTGLTPLEAEKPRKYGGAPTKQGLELFTKLALTEDHLRIAGVLVGSGIVSDDVYIGDNTHIENCIVESRDTLRANTYFSGGDGIKVVYEHNERYVI